MSRTIWVRKIDLSPTMVRWSGPVRFLGTTDERILLQHTSSRQETLKAAKSSIKDAQDHQKRQNIESGKEFKRINGAHLKQYVTPPNSPENLSLGIDAQSSFDSPPLSPLPSVDEQLRDDFDS
uniref:Uncharacterized protein n=1 Tax=Amphimedon queenslandica TaxID=400682 RepID=A0A1X7U6Q4_AMPQE